MFSKNIPLKTLAMLCKSLATMLHSGVALLKVLDIVSRKTGDAACRSRLAAVTSSVQQGTDIAAALREQGTYFPDLMVDMVAMGEQTGALPEVLDGLASHYENVARLRRDFMTIIAWPVLQLLAAIFIVAALIYFLGIVGEIRGGPGTKPVDMLGWGLLGASGAIKWLVMSLGSIACVFGGYYVATNVFRQKRFLDSLLMRIPVVGGCLQAFGMARFSWAFALTQQSGMPIARSLESSLRATANGAFVGAAPRICELVLAGEELSTALTSAGLFPEDYLHIVQVAETSGTVPETLERLSPQFEDQARRSLRMMAAALGWAVWALVAVMIIFIIFSVFLQYLGILNAAAAGTL